MGQGNFEHSNDAFRKGTDVRRRHHHCQSTQGIFIPGMLPVPARLLIPPGEANQARRSTDAQPHRRQARGQTARTASQLPLQTQHEENRACCPTAGLPAAKLHAPLLLRCRVSELRSHTSLTPAPPSAVFTFARSSVTLEEEPPHQHGPSSRLPTRCPSATSRRSHPGQQSSERAMTMRRHGVRRVVVVPAVGRLLKEGAQVAGPSRVYRQPQIPKSAAQRRPAVDPVPGGRDSGRPCWGRPATGFEKATHMSSGASRWEATAPRHPHPA